MAIESEQMAAQTSRAPETDAMGLLKSDLALINRLFLDYERTPSAVARESIVTEIRRRMMVLALIEEEIFFPEIEYALSTTSLDLKELGARMAARKADLLGEVR